MKPKKTKGILQRALIGLLSAALMAVSLPLPAMAAGIAEMLPPAQGQQNSSFNVENGGQKSTSDAIRLSLANRVQVTVENKTFSKADGAAWDGTLVDKQWIDIGKDSTMMSAVVSALEAKGYSQKGAENNYISEINGLGETDGGPESGWMGTLNDWFTTEGFSAYTVADGTLENGDEIRIMYTTVKGDLNGDADPANKTLSALSVSTGALFPSFAPGTKEYTLTLPYGAKTVTVTPTAANKGYQVHTNVDGTEYKRTAAIPVSNGTVITVICGDPSWPTMNEGADIPEETYTLQVKIDDRKPENKQPARKAGIGAEAQAAISAAGEYALNLSTIFEDVDGDLLTYTVVINGASPVVAAEQYRYAPGKAGTDTLVFAASDGKSVSKDTYKVTLTASEVYLIPIGENGIDSIQIDGSQVLSHSVAISGKDRTYTVLLKPGTADGEDLWASFVPTAGSATKFNPVKTTVPPQLAGAAFNGITSVTDYSAQLTNGIAQLATYCYPNSSAVVTGPALHTLKFVLFTGAESISVATPPAKMEYIAGESFSPSGMVVTDNLGNEIQAFSWRPSGPLSAGDTKITISYGGLTAEQPVTVKSKAIAGIAVTKAPSKKAYTVGDCFSTNGMAVKYRYNDGTDGDTVTSFTVTPDGPLLLTDTAITITAGEYSCQYPITVVENTPPSLKSGVEAEVSLTLGLGKAFEVDLSKIFEDKNGDPLTYTVQVDTQDAVSTGKDYRYARETECETVLVFHANDGKVESASAYTVRLTFTNDYEAQVKPLAGNGVSNVDGAAITVWNAQGETVALNAQNTYALSGSATYEVALDGCFTAAGNITQDKPEITVTLNALREETSEVDWRGAMNRPSGSNNTAAMLPRFASETYEAWSVKLTSSGTGYTGAVTVAGSYMYTTCGSKLYKIEKDTGEIVKQVSGGSSGNYYDYLAYGDGMVFVATAQNISAYDADTLGLLWQTSVGGETSTLVDGAANAAGTTGNFRPLVYHDGYLFVGKNAFSARSFETNAQGKNTPAWSIDDDFNWNSGAYVGDTYYVTSAQTIYAVNYKTGKIIDQWRFSSDKGVFTWSGVAYSADTSRLYWASYAGGKMNSVQLNADGSFADGTEIVRAVSQSAVTTPLLYGGRVYLVGQSGNVDVLDAATLETIYINKSGAPQTGKVQGEPILTTAYAGSNLEKPGLVYIYYQGYTTPANMFVMSDWAGNTQPQAIVPVAAASLPQYSYEQIAAGPDGSLYFSNDSGSIFRFLTAEGKLDSLEIAQAVSPLPFASDVITYEATVPAGTSEITLNWAAPTGTIVKINDILQTGGSSTIAIPADKTIVISVSTAADSRERKYMVMLHDASTDASLADLKLSSSNAFGSGIFETTPAFSPEKQYYVQELAQPNRTSVNIWPKAQDKNAKITVIAGQGLQNQGKEIPVTAINQGRERYLLSFTAGADIGTADIVVRAENGKDKNTYTVVLVKNQDSTPPVISGVSSTDLNVTVTASDNTFLAPTAYSFDGGVSWQAEKIKKYATALTLPADTIQVRDAVGNISKYGQETVLKDPAIPTSLSITVPKELKRRTGYDWYHYFTGSIPGDTFTLTAVTPVGTDGRVRWSGNGSASGISIDPASGEVTVSYSVKDKEKYVTFTAVSLADSSVKASVNVYVIPPMYAYNDKTEINVTLPEKGGSITSTDYFFVYPDIYNSYGDGLLSWTATDSSIAEVVKSGSVCYVKGLKPGTTTITATNTLWPEKKLNFTAKVSGVLVTSAGGKDRMLPGEILHLSAAGVSANETFLWESSDPQVAAVDENGIVTAKKEGYITIYAKSSLSTVEKPVRGGIQLLVARTANAPYLENLEITNYATFDGMENAAAFFSPATFSYEMAAKNPSATTMNLSWKPYFDVQKYTLTALYQDAAGVPQEESFAGSGAKMDVPLSVGENIVTLRLADKADAKNKTEYVFHVARPRNTAATLKAMNVLPEQRELSDAPLIDGKKEGTFFRLNAQGEPTTSTGVTAATKGYRLSLFDDVDKIRFGATATDIGAHLRMRVGQGKPAALENGAQTQAVTLTGEETVITVEVCSDSTYYQNQQNGVKDPFTVEDSYTVTIGKFPIAAGERDKAQISTVLLSAGTFCTPVFTPDSTAAGILLPPGAASVILTMEVPDGTELYNGRSVSSSKLLAPGGNGKYTLEVTGSSQDLTIRREVNGAALTRTYSFTVYNQADVAGMPDRVVDYLCPGSQYTNSSSYGLFPERSLVGGNTWSTPISVGNFGGYITYEFNEPIRNDSKHPYGVDFTVYGNSNGGQSFSEPGSVYVSADGSSWYELAGSDHYDDNAIWDYQVTYLKGDGSGASYEDNKGNSAPLAAMYKYPLQANYPLYAWEEGSNRRLTVSGTLLASSATDPYGSSAAAYPEWGYADVSPNGSMNEVGNPYTAKQSSAGYGDGFDISWAVDSKGAPVALKAIKYVRVQTASFITAGMLGEKSTEVNRVVRATESTKPVGVTKAPQITVNGVPLSLQAGKQQYTVPSIGSVSIKVNASENSNVYINNQLTFERTFAQAPREGIIRIVVQEGEKEPLITYITLTVPPIMQEMYADTGRVLYQTVSNPVVSTTGGEWAVIGLARSDYEVGSGYYGKYIANVMKTLKETHGVLHDKKYTEYSRVVLALTAIGYDVTDVAGYNLLEPLADYAQVVWQGINGPAWALIAFDSHGYDIPAAPSGVKQSTRENLIQAILDAELPSGGWTLSGSAADVDMTGMAIQALAPYYKSQNKVKAAVDRALAKLSALQKADGAFSSGGAVNTEACVQVLVALTALGINPDADARFIKNNQTVLNALSGFYVEGKGFKHISTGGVSGMATEQGYYALCAYQRLLEGKNALYDMTDVTFDAPYDRVIAMIEAIGTVTLEKAQAISAARTAYDVLSPANKARVENYSVLVRAEEEISRMLANIRRAEAKINAIGTVALDSKQVIQAAREVYEKLTTAEKVLVSNYVVLTDAEAKLVQLENAERVVKLIEEIGTVTRSKADKIRTARKAYNDLTTEERVLVRNYSVLTAAERRLDSLLNRTVVRDEPGLGEVRIELGGVSYIVREKAGSVIQKIAENALKGEAVSDAAVIEVYKLYSTLPNQEKAQVINYPDLEEQILRIQTANQWDGATGMRLEGESWNIKMNVKPVEAVEAAYRNLSGSIGSGEILLMFQVKLQNILDGRAYQPQHPVTLKIPAGSVTEHQPVVIAHYMDDGRIEYIDCSVKDGQIIWNVSSFSYYAVILGAKEAVRALDSVIVTAEGALLTQDTPPVQGTLDTAIKPPALQNDLAPQDSTQIPQSNQISGEDKLLIASPGESEHSSGLLWLWIVIGCAGILTIVILLVKRNRTIKQQKSAPQDKEINA